MIRSQKERKRRKRFFTIISLILIAILICIGVLVGAYFMTKKQVNEELGITDAAVTVLLPFYEDLTV